MALALLLFLFYVLRYLTSSTDTNYGEALAIVRPDGSGPVQVAAESPLGSAQTEIPWREEGNDHESYR